jgi:hypothetical protein
MSSREGHRHRRRDLAGREHSMEALNWQALWKVLFHITALGQCPSGALLCFCSDRIDEFKAINAEVGAG